MTDTVAPVGAKRTREGVRIDWSDGQSAALAAIWLRDNCRCELCGDTAVGWRFVSLSQLDVHPQAIEAALDSAGALRVVWADGHVSLYGPAWLARHARQATRWRPLLWDATAPPDLAGLDAARALDGGAGTLAMLRLLRDQGLALLHGVGPAPEETEAAMSVLGPIQVTSYGRSYDILSEGDAMTLYDATQDLIPHTDEPFRYTPPGILAFHAVSPAAEGGDSILIDGFRLAEEVRRRDPQTFDMLSSVPQTFERQLEGRFDLRCNARAIAVDGHGAVCGVRFAELSTSPPRLPNGAVAAFYQARRLLTDLIGDPAFRVVVRLGAGDMLLIDNHRLMHGRTATAGPRFLRQCSVAREDAHSVLRMIARRLGEADADYELPMGALA